MGELESDARGRKGTKASNRLDAASHRFIFRTACKNQVVYLHCSPAGCETFYKAQAAGEMTQVVRTAQWQLI